MKCIEWINTLFQNRILNMKEHFKKSLALKVKALRESRGLTQEELAFKCNVSWRTISNLERGLVVPDLIMLIAIAQIFNVSIDELVMHNINNTKSKSRLEREQFIIEKIKFLNDKALDFLFDEIVLIFRHFN